MYIYYNANPLGRKVNDCTVRAISLATGKSWDYTYSELSNFAQAQAIMADDVTYIDDYLARRYTKVYDNDYNNRITLEEFTHYFPHGIYLITMSGHITCCIDGNIYDTFDPSHRYIWEAYCVEK